MRAYLKKTKLIQRYILYLKTLQVIDEIKQNK